MSVKAGEIRGVGWTVGHIHLQVGHRHLQVGHRHLQVGHIHLQVGHIHLQVGHRHLQVGHIHLQVGQTSQEIPKSQSNCKRCNAKFQAFLDRDQYGIYFKIKIHIYFILHDDIITIKIN